MMGFNDLFALSPIALILLSAIIALFGRYIWARWLSKTSRVTAETCVLRQQICRQELLAKLKKREAVDLLEAEAVAKRLDCGEKEFNTHSKVLAVILMTQLKICTKLEIDCTEIGKAMVHNGLVE